MYSFQIMMRQNKMELKMQAFMIYIGNSFQKKAKYIFLFQHMLI